MRRIFNGVSLAGVLATIAWACSGGGSNGGTPTPTTPTPPAATVSSVTVSGTAPLVGATTEFMATANLSNGTIQTVTSQATWQSSNTSVATVSTAGRVTGVNAGVADINAIYQNVSGLSQITVTRATPVTFTVSGLVTDGTSGGVLPNVNVQTTDSGGTVKTTSTNSAGNYSIGGVASGAVTVTASAPDYQTTTKTIDVTGDTRADVVLPRAPSTPVPGLTCNGSSVPSIVDCLNGQPPGPPSAQCNDGAFSCSQTRSGTCSKHEGVKCYVCPGPLCNP